MVRFDPTIHTLEYLKKMIKEHGAYDTATILKISYMTLNRWLKILEKQKPPTPKKPKETREPKKRNVSKITNITQFIAWLKANPNNRHYNYFTNRLKNPRRPDDSTIMKMIEIMVEVNC